MTMPANRNRIRKLTAAILALIMALFLTGCQGNDDSGENASPSSNTNLNNHGELQIGDTAPDFSVELLTGETVKLSDYRGKTVLLNFWATWCAPCINEMPDIQRISDEYADDVVVLAIDYGEAADTVSRFIRSKGYTFPVGIDPTKAVSNLYPTSGIPYTLIINAAGVITDIQLGTSNDMFAIYSGYIDKALGT